MIDLTPYGFVVARAPKAEGLTLQSVVEKVTKEVFVGWPGKWESEAWNKGFDYKTWHVFDELQLVMSVFVTDVKHSVSIEFMDEVAGEEYIMADAGAQHAKIGNGGHIDSVPVNLAFAEALEVVVRKAVAEAKEYLVDMDTPQSRQLLAVIAKWKS